MRVTILRDWRGLKAGRDVTFVLELTNYIVGRNGSGKSSLLVAVLSELARGDHAMCKAYWPVVERDKEVVRLEGFENVSSVFLMSEAMSRAEMSDVGTLMCAGGGLSRLHASSGTRTALSLSALKSVSGDARALTLLDEVDAHLDYQNRSLVFKQVLPSFRCTSLVVTHDVSQIADQMVFDVDAWAWCSGADYMAQF